MILLSSNSTINLFIFLYRYPHLREDYPYNQVLGLMKSWRKKIFPKNPTSFEEFIDVIRAPANSKLLQYDEGFLDVRVVVDSNGDKHVLFFDRELIQTEFYELKNIRLLIDTTFKVLPIMIGAYQVLIIMCVKMDHVSCFSNIF